MRRNEGAYLVDNKKQLTVLASAVRQEIMDVLSQMGTVPVSDVAAMLGRPADGLYYHLRVLKKAGLVMSAGYQGEGIRREELVRSVSSDMRLRYVTGKSGNSRQITPIVSSMLRLGIRDFRRGFQNEELTVAGPGRELWAFRKTMRLNRSEVVELNEWLDRLVSRPSKPPADGRLYGITVLLTPLDHRARKSKGRRAATKKGKSK